MGVADSLPIRLLDVADPNLFERCYRGLIKRAEESLEECSVKEKRDWESILERLKQMHAT